MQKDDATVEAALKSPTRPRGRPRAFDRDVALAAATRLFWTKGFEATSISDLTEAMGIGSPSLYAAFGSKEELYAEALRYYGENFEMLFWAGFFSAESARNAVLALLMDSAAALTGCRADIPLGCMVALSAVGNEGHDKRGELVRATREDGFDRLKARFDHAKKVGELGIWVDTHALARFVQTVQTGMSILARDGASREELESVAMLSMQVWDTRT
jgi:AcrR family transcriptional regulator